MGAGDGELHALVLADRPAEDPALAGIGGGPLDEPAPSPMASPESRMRSAFMPSDVAKALALDADVAAGTSDRDEDLLVL